MDGRRLCCFPAVPRGPTAAQPRPNEEGTMRRHLLLAPTFALALERNACTDRNGAAGDHTLDQSGAAYTVGGNFDWWLDAVAVHTSTATGTVVAVGDSITDGYCTGIDSHQRWTDVLAGRLAGSLGVANEGISGNRVTADGAGPSALHR